MTFLRSSLFAVVTALVASCGGSQTPPTQEPPITRPADPDPTVKVGGVDLAVASVSLADDCGTGPTGAPIAQEPIAAEVAPGPAAAGDSASITEEDQAKRMASAGARACEQSTLQLRVANTSEAAAGISIKKIEVLDESGAVVGELTPRAPSQWTGDTYAAWDEQVGPAQTVQASYALSAPYVGRGATYTVRITVASGDAEGTVERKVTLEAYAELPPDVVT